MLANSSWKAFTLSIFAFNVGSCCRALLSQIGDVHGPYAFWKPQTLRLRIHTRSLGIRPEHVETPNAFEVGQPLVQRKSESTHSSCTA
jgi:hypothetical protein